MNQIAEIQASKFACFNHLASEVKNEQIKSLFYIERMAGVSNTDITQIDIFEVFGRKDADKALLLTSKGDINKRLAALSTAPRANPSQDLSEAQIASIEAMNQSFMQRQTGRLQDLKSTKSGAIHNADSLTTRVNAYLKQAWEAEIEIQRITGHTPNFKGEFEKIVADGFWDFLETSAGKVHFVTKNEIVLAYRNAKSGIDLQVNMGKYKATYDARSNSVTVGRHQRNPIVYNAYYHPYINYSGSICFGNSSGQASKLLLNLELAEFFSLLSALLSTYSVDSNPYYSLETFADAASKGTYEIVVSCRRCGAAQGACGCQRCPQCAETYASYCPYHWCKHCETYNKHDCSCCQECGTTTAGDADSHEEYCSEYEREQTAVNLDEEEDIAF